MFIPNMGNQEFMEYITNNEELNAEVGFNITRLIEIATLIDGGMYPKREASIMGELLDMIIGSIYRQTELSNDLHEMTLAYQELKGVYGQA